ncbi:MAG: glycosyltransferase family 4 protein [Chitinispirillaceae bacterium]|nr:glycosyltransferase family 4 protein [Chitinispirillaceae bacterium]
MAGILVSFHCESNPGFAASSHELTFFKMAQRLVGDTSNIHFSYRTLENGRSSSLPDDFHNIIEFDTSNSSRSYLQNIQNYIQKNGIEVVFGFDMPVKRPGYRFLRRGGVRHIVSYWGAPMSSINRGFKLLFKKIDVSFAANRPDHFIFQSEGMRLSATNGRGISRMHTSIVRTGIDTERFCPSAKRSHYAHETFGIPGDKKIVFFSGHMEARKGVDVILKTAAHLVNTLKRDDTVFLLLGNKNGEEKVYYPLFKGTPAEKYIVFGGYRKDVPEILKSSHIGMIASTGWDSFPMSSIEMAATGLPLVVSDLPGLQEAVSNDTGFLFETGNPVAAAQKLEQLLDNEPLRVQMGLAGRSRAVKLFSVEQQINGIEAVIRSVTGKTLNTTH